MEDEGGDDDKAAAAEVAKEENNEGERGPEGKIEIEGEKIAAAESTTPAV